MDDQDRDDLPPPAWPADGADLAQNLAAQVNSLITSAVEAAYIQGHLRGLREGSGDAAIVQRLSAAAGRIAPALALINEKCEPDVPEHHRPGVLVLYGLLNTVAKFGHHASRLLERGAWTALHRHLGKPPNLAKDHHDTARALRNVSSPLAPVVHNAVADAREVLDLADTLHHQIRARLASSVSGTGTLVLDDSAEDRPGVIVSMDVSPPPAAAAAAMAIRREQIERAHMRYGERR